MPFRQTDGDKSPISFRLALLNKALLTQTIR